MNSSIIHDNIILKRCHPKSCHSDTKYHVQCSFTRPPRKSQNYMNGLSSILQEVLTSQDILVYFNLNRAGNISPLFSICKSSQSYQGFSSKQSFSKNPATVFFTQHILPRPCKGQHWSNGTFTYDHEHIPYQCHRMYRLGAVIHSTFSMGDSIRQHQTDALKCVRHVKASIHNVLTCQICTYTAGIT